MRIFQSYKQVCLLLIFCLIGAAFYLLTENPVALFAFPLVGMALSADTPQAYEQGFINTLPVLANAVIYEGAAVGLSSGYARGLVAGDRFQGFCREKVTGTASNGGINVKVQDKGKIKATLASVAVTDVGSKAYMSADGTFTLTSSGNSQVGHVHRYVTTNTCIIEFYVTGQ